MLRGVAKKILQEYGIYISYTSHHCGGEKGNYSVLDREKLERFLGMSVEELCKEFEIG